MGTEIEEKRGTVAAIALLVVFYLALYGRFLLGQGPVGGEVINDVINHYLPYQHVIRGIVRGGELPLWNEMTFLGRPLMADIQNGVLYPPNWLHWVLPLPVSFSLTIALHGAFMIWGCWRVGRAWGLRPEAVALGAILFCGAPFFTLKLGRGIILFIYVGAWWPWLALGATRLMQRPDVTSMLALAGGLSMSLLAGGPQLTYYGWLATLGVATAMLGAEGEGKWKRIGMVAGAYAIALGLTAAQTLPTYHFVQYSFERGGGADWGYATQSSLEPRLLWLLLNPGFLGVGWSEKSLYWGEMTDFAESCFYSPLWVALALVPAGLAAWRGSGTRLHGRLLWLGLAGIIIGPALALGRHSLLFEMFYRFVPGFDSFRVPARLMIYWIAGWAVVAAVAMDALLEAKAERKRIAGIAAAGAGAIIVMLMATLLMREQIWRELRNPLMGNPENLRILSAHAAAMGARVAGAALLAAGAIAAVTVGRGRSAWMRIAPAAIAGAELVALALPFQAGLSWGKYLNAFYPRTQLVAALESEHRGGAVLWLDNVMDYYHDQNQPEVLTNRLAPHGLPSARGYDPINARWTGTWFNMLAGLEPEEKPGAYMFVPQVARPAWLTLMGVETVLSYRPLDGVAGLREVAAFEFPPDPEVPGARAGRLGVWRNEWFMGRGFAAPVAPLASDWASAMARSALFANDARTSPLAALVLTGGGIAQLETMRWAGSVDGRWRVSEVEAGSSRFRFEVDYPEAAFLCLAQSAYPGWRATVDGAPAEFLTDYCGAFLAAPVPAGEHVVEFAFMPHGLRTGAGLSGATLLICAWLGVRARRKTTA